MIQNLRIVHGIAESRFAGWCSWWWRLAFDLVIMQIVLWKPCGRKSPCGCIPDVYRVQILFLKHARELCAKMGSLLDEACFDIIISCAAKCWESEGGAWSVWTWCQKLQGLSHTILATTLAKTFLSEEKLRRDSADHSWALLVFLFLVSSCIHSSNCISILTFLLLLLLLLQAWDFGFRMIPSVGPSVFPACILLECPCYWHCKQEGNECHGYNRCLMFLSYHFTCGGNSFWIWIGLIPLQFRMKVAPVEVKLLVIPAVQSAPWMSTNLHLGCVGLSSTLNAMQDSNIQCIPF